MSKRHHKTEPAPHHPDEGASGITVNVTELAELFSCSPRTIVHYVASGKIAKASPGRYFLKSAVNYLIQIRVADNVIAGMKRNEKLDAEVKKLRLDSELKSMEIDSAHRERLSLLTSSDMSALQLHGRIFAQLALHAAKSLAIEIGTLLSAVPKFSDWTNRELAELSCAFAEAWVNKESEYLLGPDGAGFPYGECWKDAQVPAVLAEKPRNFLDGTPFWVDDGTPDGTRWGRADEPAGWWRGVRVDDTDPLRPRYKFERLDNYSAEPPRSVLRALMALGRDWRRALKGDLK